MNRVLVSACLLGRKVRYDGREKMNGHPMFDRWAEEGRLVPFCPETAAGLSTPRLPAEIQDGASGQDVLAGHATITDSSGMDVTEHYVRAAHLTLELAQREGCGFAILTDGSPSCATTFLHDGHFRGHTRAGMGATAALLEMNSILVFSQMAIDQVDRMLRAADMSSSVPAAPARR